MPSHPPPPTLPPPDKSPVFSDELTEPRYVVEIDRSGASTTPAPPDARTLTLTDRTGRAFQCAVPLGAGADEGGDASDASSTDARPPSAIVAAALTSTCQVRHEDWWTYEFCYGKHVRQYHVEGGGVATSTSTAGAGGVGGDITDEFVLGVADGPSSTPVTDTTDTDPSSPLGQSVYVSSTYADGAPCDLTRGKRAAEVRFECPDGGGAPPGDAAPGAPAATGVPGAPVLLSAREPATCTYVVTVAVPALCGHAAFRRVEPPTRTIVCRPVGDEVVAGA